MRWYMGPDLNNGFDVYQCNGSVAGEVAFLLKKSTVQYSDKLNQKIAFKFSKKQYCRLKLCH